jgi:hypothetical protein
MLLCAPGHRRPPAAPRDTLSDVVAEVASGLAGCGACGRRRAGAYSGDRPAHFRRCYARASAGSGLPLWNELKLVAGTRDLKLTAHLTRGPADGQTDYQPRLGREKNLRRHSPGSRPMVRRRSTVRVRQWAWRVPCYQLLWSPRIRPSACRRTPSVHRARSRRLAVAPCKPARRAWSEVPVPLAPEHGFPGRRFDGTITLPPETATALRSWPPGTARSAARGFANAARALRPRVSSEIDPRVRERRPINQPRSRVPLPRRGRSHTRSR